MTKIERKKRILKGQNFKLNSIKQNLKQFPFKLNSQIESFYFSKYEYDI